MQGECPEHGSSSGRCLTIYPKTQSFYCFHCKKHGDVINLVMQFKRWDHRTAVNYLADKCDMPRLGADSLSDEKKGRLEAEYREEKIVREMLTEAARWYHSQLDPQIKRSNKPL
jgi:DNA primase